MTIKHETCYNGYVFPIQVENLYYILKQQKHNYWYKNW